MIKNKSILKFYSDKKTREVNVCCNKFKPLEVAPDCLGGLFQVIHTGLIRTSPAPKFVWANGAAAGGAYFETILNKEIDGETCNIFQSKQPTGAALANLPTNTLIWLEFEFVLGQGDICSEPFIISTCTPCHKLEFTCTKPSLVACDFTHSLSVFAVKTINDNPPRLQQNKVNAATGNQKNIFSQIQFRETLIVVGNSSMIEGLLQANLADSVTVDGLTVENLEIQITGNSKLCKPVKFEISYTYCKIEKNGCN